MTAARQASPQMREQMLTHCRYLQRCRGWTGDDCRLLASDYHDAMQTDEGFAAIEAHLASVTPIEQAALARLERAKP